MGTRLEITRQNAEIEVRTVKARVEISTRRPRFRLRRNIAQFRVDRRLPMMRLDRTAMYNALGIGPVLQAARQYYQDSIHKNIENIAQIAAEGNMMADIENGANAIADLGVNVMEGNEREMNISALPNAEINWEPGYININWTPGTFDMEWDVSTWADIRVEPHYVEIRMKKYPEVRIRVHYEPKQQKPGGKYVDKYL